MITVPLMTGAILVAVAVFGSTKSTDRVFRLLRWLRDKEEPPAPVQRDPVASTGLPSRGRQRPGVS